MLYPPIYTFPLAIVGTLNLIPVPNAPEYSVVATLVASCAYSIPDTESMSQTIPFVLAFAEMDGTAPP